MGTKSRPLTTTEAAERLGVTREHVTVLIRRGLLPAVRFGRDWQIDPDDLAALPERKLGRPKAS